jgi:uncharacterized integral membrane protein
MMRFLRYLLLVVVGLMLLTMALANRAPVPLQLLPDNLGAFLGFNGFIVLPAFLVIFAGMIAGLLIGFVWEWMREHKHRSTASVKSREVAKLEREVSRLREAKAEPKDEVLALLDDRRKAG